MSFQSGNLPAVGTGALLPQITRNWLYQKACKIRGLFALPFRKQKTPFFQIHPRFSFLYPSVRCRILPTSGKENKMKKRNIRKTAAALTALALCAGVLTGCGGAASSTASSVAASSAASSEASGADADELAAQNVADLIDAIYVQQRTDDTDAQCEAAKAAWDALTDAQKELVEGENADPDYFGRDTGDAPRTMPATPMRSVRTSCWWCPSAPPSTTAALPTSRALRTLCRPLPRLERAPCLHCTDHHQPCAGTRWREDRQYAAGTGPRCGKRCEEPDRAATHLMHGAEYDEMNEMLDQYRDKFESVAVAEPLLASGRRCFRHQCR